MATAWPARGATVAYSTGGAAVPLGEVTSIGHAGGGEVRERDSTVLSSNAIIPNPTLPDLGEITFALNFDLTDAAHRQVLQWVYSPPTSVVTWTFGFSTSPASTVEVQAWVKRVDGVDAGGVDDNLEAEVTLRVAGWGTFRAGDARGGSAHVPRDVARLERPADRARGIADGPDVRPDHVRRREG